MKVALLVVQFLLAVANCAECPDGWINFITTTDRCVKGFRNKLTWFDAYVYCQSQGANLVSIHNAFQNTLVAKIGQMVLSSCLYWIGLSDVDYSGAYTWVDGTEANYTHWDPDSDQPPAGMKGANAYLSLEHINRWLASADTDEANCFVCERVAGTPSYDCPDGWDVFDDSGTKCIKGYAEPTSWIGAYQLCVETSPENNGSLVSIHSPLQNFRVAAVAKKTSPSCLYWIGLQDFSGTGALNWIDDSPLDYTDWMPGFPPANPEYTTAYMSLQEHQQWMTTPDIGKEHCFVCERTAQKL